MSLFFYKCFAQNLIEEKKYNGIKAFLTSASSAHFIIDSIQKMNANI